MMEQNQDPVNQENRPATEEFQPEDASNTRQENPIEHPVAPVNTAPAQTNAGPPPGASDAPQRQASEPINGAPTNQREEPPVLEAPAPADRPPKRLSSVIVTNPPRVDASPAEAVSSQKEINQLLTLRISELTREVGSLRTHRRSGLDSHQRKSSRDSNHHDNEDQLREAGLRSKERAVRRSDHRDERRLREASSPSPSRELSSDSDYQRQPEGHKRSGGSRRRSEISEGRDDRYKEFRDEIKEMKTLVRRVTSSAPEVDDILTETESTPFTRRVTRTKVPMNNKLRLPIYDGVEDPMVFLRAFNVKVARADFGRATEDQGKCQLFVESLRGEAQAWFTKLPKDSIGSFEDLRTIFINQYMMFREEPLKPIDLTSTKQGPKENLQDFIRRFKDVYAKIRIPDDLALDSLIQGLRQGSNLRLDLTSRRPHSMVDAFYRAHVHIKMEDANDRPTPFSETSKKKEPTANANADLRQTGNRNGRKQRRNVFSVFKNRTFKRPWNNTYRRNQPADLQGTDLGNASGPVSEEETQHRSDDKQTELELGNHPLQRGSRQPRVNVILERSTTPHRRVRMEPLKVTEAQEELETQGPIQPNISFADDEQPVDGDDHADLLIIQAFIAGYKIRGVLIDTGSTVNVIDTLTLAEMRTNISRINFQSKGLVSFGGSSVDSVGSILLPVAVYGSPQHYQFEVVNRPIGYSVILGAPWLHETKALVSVHHQCLKIPVPGGYFPVKRDRIAQPPLRALYASSPRTTREPDSESDEEDEEYPSGIPRFWYEKSRRM